MRQPKEVSNALEEYLPFLRGLQKAVSPLLSGIAKEQKGFFEDRIKAPESTACKLMKGEYKSITDCVDLYACTIVLPSQASVEAVVKLIPGHFTVIDIRSNRVKKPNVFDYDDVHFILKLKVEAYEEEGPANRIPFELQVKTLLQYAVAKATHDVLYKSGRATSRRIRLAAQIRATFEMAEGLLARIEIADDVLKFDEQPRLAQRRQIVDILKGFWNEDDLPEDLRRTAVIIERYLELGEKKACDLEQVLNNSPEVIGSATADPLTAVLAAILKESGAGFVDRARMARLSFLIPGEASDVIPSLRLIPNDLRVTFGLDQVTSSAKKS